MGNENNKIRDYTLVRLIGEGGYGTVFHATRNEESFAMKRIRLYGNITE